MSALRTLTESELAQNEIAEPIHELIGKLDGWGHIPALFRTIINHRAAEYRPWRGRLSFLMDGRPLCWVNHKGDLRLGYSDNKVATKAVFEVSSAERRASEAQTRLIAVSPAPKPRQGRISFRKRLLGNDTDVPADKAWEPSRLSRSIYEDIVKVGVGNDMNVAPDKAREPSRPSRPILEYMTKVGRDNALKSGS